MKKQEAAIDSRLRNLLLRRRRRDQRVRNRINRILKPGNTFPDEMRKSLERIDSKNTETMKRVIDRHGWPGKSLVGSDGADAAWLLVQHADLDADFQRSCLDLLSNAVETGEAEPWQHAYLLDRVRIHNGQPQVYGTQMKGSSEGWIPFSIEDEAGVDSRRREVGLGPLSERVAAMNERER